MTESLIFIDKNTSFNGSIEAKQVVVEGNVEGDIIASDKVLVKNGGMVNGTINTDKLLLEEGARHNGRIRLGYSVTQKNGAEISPEQSSEFEPAEQENKDEDTSRNRSYEKETTKRLW